MKRIVLTALMGTLAAGAAFGQGTVTFANSSGTAFQTNGTALGYGAGNTLGGALNAGLFDYEVLTAPSTVGPVDASLQGLLTSVWSDTGILASNTASLTGRASSPNGTALNWAAGAQQAYIVIGWSAALGSFANIEADLSGAILSSNASGLFWTGVHNVPTTGNYFIGASAIGSGVAGGTVNGNSVPPFALFGSSAGPSGTPIETTTSLYIVSVPEPTTFAMMGLGAAAMLIFRRRK